jgi:polyhydroxybutyrate depolymerase
MHLIAISLLASYVMVQAQDINLTGRVTNKNAIPVHHAKLSLKKAGLSTETNVEGLFTLSPTVGIKAVASGRTEYVALQNGVIHVTTKESEFGEIAVYDFSGKKVTTLFAGNLQKGENTLDISGKLNSLANHIYIFKVTVGGRSMSGNCLSDGGRFVIYETGINDGIAFSKTGAAGVDQLSISAAGYRDTVLAIEKYTANLGDIKLSQEDGCGSGGWIAGDRAITLTFGGVTRKYEVHIPKSYTAGASVPLMLVIHGAHNTMAMARSWSQMNTVSDANGFVVAYPQGIDCWNCGFSISSCKVADDDVGFIRAVVGDIEKNVCIDPKRVYATGISNGSMMTAFLGCKAADLFAAVGGVSGGVSGSCSPSRPISYFYVHGTVDKTIPFSSAQSNVDGWVKRNGCNSTPVETYNVGSTRCVTYKDCKDGVEVVFCTVTGMGHCWPEDKSCLGTSDNPGDFKMSPMNWEFFKRFTLP